MELNRLPCCAGQGKCQWFQVLRNPDLIELPINTCKRVKTLLKSITQGFPASRGDTGLIPLPEIPRAARQLSSCAMATEPMVCNGRGHRSENTGHLGE